MKPRMISHNEKQVTIYFSDHVESMTHESATNLADELLQIVAAYNDLTEDSK